MHSFGSVFTLETKNPRLHIVVDEGNTRAVEIAKRFSKFEDKQSNMILVCGGDGFMLDSLRRYWHKRLPFLGVNAGHKGFLLNNPDLVTEDFPKEVRIYDLPLLEVEITLQNSKIKRAIAFNDSWVERANGQSAWIEVKVNGVVRLPKLVADAALISTPAGSTAYARSMGAWPVPLDAQTLVLVGSNVVDPSGFCPCYLPIGSSVEFTNLDPSKRPLIGLVDGIRVGKVHSMKASVCRTASIQLANVGEYGLPEKLLGIQFPKD